MDESWRMRMGMPAGPHTPHRRMAGASSPTAAFTHRRSSLSESLDPDDFADVFGGPPQTVLLRKFSGDFSFAASSPTSFYNEVFRPPELSSPATRSGRSLPAFRIPDRADAFYGDIFGLDCDRRSRDRTRPGSKGKSKPKSRSNTDASSVLSSEDLSPLRPAVGDDAGLSSFASKLRPINVPCRWNSSTFKPDEPFMNQAVPPFPSTRASPTETPYSEAVHMQQFRSPFSGFPKPVTSPETISINPSSYRSVKISGDDIGVNSPAASEVSSLCHQEPECQMVDENNNLTAEEEVIEDNEEEDEISSSFVIEIGSNQREGAGETEGVDEAIAWAKERFNAHRDWKESTPTKQGNENMSTEDKEENTSKYFHESKGGHHKSHFMENDDEELRKEWVREDGNRQSENTMEMQQVDEDIRSWSAGKENNIRLLLLTLHQILWPKSGWGTLPITSLIESSHVKKAYQKARLCLHPDKLQQRGATAREKYIAEKAFSILQDAWTAFTSQDILFG